MFFFRKTKQKLLSANNWYGTNTWYISKMYAKKQMGKKTA